MRAVWRWLVPMAWRDRLGAWRVARQRRRVMRARVVHGRPHDARTAWDHE